MTKATHYGTCQYCGARQKLPAGALSKHGYTVQYGFFSGICLGTDHLPYEQSCELVKESIVWAQGMLQRAETNLTKWSNCAENPAWVHEYDRRSCKYHWVQREVRAYLVATTESGRNLYYPQWDRADGKVETYTSGSSKYSLDEILCDTNAWYARDVWGRQIRELQQYIKSQQERVANWKPAELRPV